MWQNIEKKKNKLNQPVERNVCVKYIHVQIKCVLLYDRYVNSRSNELAIERVTVIDTCLRFFSFTYIHACLIPFTFQCAHVNGSNIPIACHAKIQIIHYNKITKEKGENFCNKIAAPIA